MQILTQWSEGATRTEATFYGLRQKVQHYLTGGVSRVAFVAQGERARAVGLELLLLPLQGPVEREAVLVGDVALVAALAGRHPGLPGRRRHVRQVHSLRHREPRARRAHRRHAVPAGAE